MGKLRESFGKAPLTKAVLDLLVGMVDKGECRDEKFRVSKMLEIIKSTKGKSEAEVGYVGGNAATLLVKVDNEALEDKDLSGAVVKGGDFIDASLRRVNFTHTNLVESTFTQPFSLVLSLAFSPDDKLLVTGGADGEIRLWQVSDGKQIFSFRGHNDWVSSVAFSPDSKIIASCSHSGDVKLWHSQTKQLLKTLL